MTNARPLRAMRRVSLPAIRALRNLVQRHGRRVLREPLLLPRVVRRVFGLLRQGELQTMLSRHAIHADLYADYPGWFRRYVHLDEQRREALRTRAATLAGAPRFSVLVPTRDPDPATFRAAIASVVNQLYANWEIVVCDDGSPVGVIDRLLAESGVPKDRLRVVRREHSGGIAAATQLALAAATGDWIAFLDHDDLLAEDALVQFALALAAHPGWRFIYSDEDKIDEDGRHYWPHFKPDWNGEYLLASNYITHLVACERLLAFECGGLREGFDGAQDWDFVLRATERLAGTQIGHVPRVLYHWRSTVQSTAGGMDAKPGVLDAQRRVLEDTVRRRGWRAQVERGRWTWRTRWLPEKLPQVSVVIPTRDRPDLLASCLSGLLSQTEYPDIEIIIVDNGSTDSAAVALLDRFGNEGNGRVIAAPGPFNFAALCNRGVAAARGEVVVLLNNDVEPATPGWLRELAVQANREGIGAVGALLKYPDGRLQHAGIVLGINGAAEHIFRGYPGDWSGINGRCGSVQEMSAVTGACLAVRRDRYLAVGGCDESLAISQNDIDLCLRLAARGWKTLWTPYAELIHHESGTRGYAHDAPTAATLAAEAQLLRQRWSNTIEADPAYNPNLAVTGSAFSLAYPPRVGGC